MNITAAEAGCASGSGTCSVTPSTSVSGNVTWWVRAKNSAGTGPWSSPPLSFVASSSGTVPAEPTLVSPSGSGSSTPTYTWNAVSNADEYELWVLDSTTAPRIYGQYTTAQAGCASGSGTCSVTPSTSVSGNVLWWVRAKNSAGTGPWSSPLSFTASGGGTDLVSPILVSPSGSVSSTTPTYTWNAVSDADEYVLRVYDSAYPFQSPVILRLYTAAEAGCASGTGTCSVTPPTLVTGDVTWQVRAKKDVGNSPWSS